jgi:hypothetical protein
MPYGCDDEVQRLITDLVDRDKIDANDAIDMIRDALDDLYGVEGRVRIPAKGSGQVGGTQLDNLKAAAERAAGLGCDTKKATDFLQADGLDWNQYYPEVDGHGLLTGRVIGGGEAGFVVVDDAVMVEAATLPRDEQRRLVSEGRFPIWARCRCLGGHWQRDCPMNQGGVRFKAATAE